MVSYTHVQHAQPVSVAFWLVSLRSCRAERSREIEASLRYDGSKPLGCWSYCRNLFSSRQTINDSLIGIPKNPYSQLGCDVFTGFPILASSADNLNKVKKTLESEIDELKNQVADLESSLSKATKARKYEE